MRPFLFLGVSAALSAQTTLELAKPVEDDIKAGETRSYQITAKTGDLIHGKAEGLGATVAVTSFLPDGQKMRSYNDADFRFVGEVPGLYRLDVKASKPGRYRITIHEIQPLVDRLHVPI